MFLFNKEVTELSIMDTVAAMRRQRTLMVQKKEQYVYVAKCLRLVFVVQYSVSHLFLSFVVSTEKGRYYEGEKEDDEDEYYEV